MYNPLNTSRRGSGLPEGMFSRPRICPTLTNWIPDLHTKDISEKRVAKGKPP